MHHNLRDPVRTHLCHLDVLHNSVAAAANYREDAADDAVANSHVTDIMHAMTSL